MAINTSVQYNGGLLPDIILLSPPVWMQYVDPPPGTLRQTSCRTPPGLASHHRSAAQETRPPDDLVQPCP